MENDIQSSEEENDVQEFLKEYGELVKKYNIDFASYPQYIPSGTSKRMWELQILTMPVRTSVQSPEEFISEA